METPKFHWLDYTVLASFLLLSALIGVLIAYWNRHQKTTAQFLMGGRNMHYFPVSLSMVATFFSANFILGLPGEIYAFGTSYAYLSLSFLIAVPVCGKFYLPIYYKEQLTSAYQVRWYCTYVKEQNEMLSKIGSFFSKLYIKSKLHGYTTESVIRNMSLV